MKSYKKVIFSAGLLFAVVYFLVWALYVTFVYVPYEDALKKTAVLVNGAMREDGYTYGVALPSFPSFTGNLFINQDTVFYEDGTSDGNISMLIWPSARGKHIIGITISLYDPKIQEAPKKLPDGTTEYSTELTDYDFYIDKNMDLLKPKDPKTREIYQQHYEEVQQICQLADQKWNIFGDK